LKDKATLKFAVSDVFNTLDYKLTSSFAGQTIKYNLKGETRQMKLTLAFRLGSNDVKSATVRNSGAEDEMKRVK
jgi:iron complex outermembrane recepter protein